MGIYFEIQADQTDRAKRFYTDVFGWKFTKAQGTPVEYWRIETSEGRGGLLRRPAPPPPSHSGTNACVCSFEATSFDQVADAIHAAQHARKDAISMQVMRNGVSSYLGLQLTA